jgi:hypothetical protein
MTTRTGSLLIARVLMAGVLACAAGCTTIAASDSASREQAISKYADRRGGAGCFYSDVSGADRVLGYRVLHWCGPEPKALF